MVGVKNAGKLMEDIPNKVRDVLGIMVDVRLRDEPAGEVLEIAVPAYANPISYKGEYFYRSGSTNQSLKGAALDRFLLRKQGRHWDDAPVPGFGPADLSPRALAEFRRRAMRSGRLAAELLAESDAVLIEKLRLLDHGYLKRAAILLFDDDPERIATGAYVKIGRFRTHSNLLYQDEIHGDLIGQVDRTLDLLLTKYLIAGISYEGIQRVETFPIPEAALREAVINAVAHKDYSSGIPIQISVYDDRLMIWNAGLLPPDWTISNLTAKHASAPFNPDVANVFFRAALLESWGRGIDLIRETCQAHGSPPPDFRWDNGLWVELPFKVVVDPRPESGPESGPESRPESRSESRLVLRLVLRLESTLAAQIVMLLAKQSASRTEIARALAHETVSAGLKRQLKRLENLGYVKQTNPEKQNSRLQKYRLTSEGQMMLEAERQNSS